MNLTYIPHRRALAALVPATLLLAAPAVAQDTAPSPIQTTTTPPPPPAAAPEASAPPVATPMTNGVAARNGIGDPNSTTQIAPEAMMQAEEARSARPRAATPTRSAAPRATARDVPAPVSSSRAVRPTASTAASDPATTASTAPEAPIPAAPAPAAAAPGGVESATTGSAATDSATATGTAQGSPLWPWLLGALVVLGALLALFLRRRRHVVAEDEDVYVEPVDAPVAQQPFAQPPAEPAVFVPVAAEISAPHAQPGRSGQSQSQGHGRLEPQFLRTTAVAAAPVVASIAEQVEAQAVEAELAEPEPQDVAELTAGSAHGDRPWLEFALRPVRAGSDAEAAVVEIELTVGNSGTVAAQDVRISTFMFTDQSASRGDMERLLAEHSADSEVVPVTIAPGEGTRVDATLSLPRERFADDARTFNPVILADARYRMADGTEGRTSASFTIGGVAVDGDDLRGIAICRAQMSDDIEARLHGEVAHT